MEIQTNILQRLSQFGISESDISFRGWDGKTSCFTYNGWRPLPQDALQSINDLVFEDIYEDYDGDDDRGKPIIRRMWYYEFSK
jgi:hypothetical protein